MPPYPGPPAGFQPDGPVRPVLPKKGPSTAVVIGILIAVVALLAICGSVGAAGYLVYRNADESSSSADGVLDGLVDFRATSPEILTKNHRAGRITYTQSPPVGGDHNSTWQNCEGNVYTAEIPSEHAVHSMEHGAVWLTYQPSLDSGDVEKLARKIRGKAYTLMSPYPGLDEPISLQAWGYQLKLDSAEDEDIDRFIAKYAQTAALEPGATCGGGVTTTGTEPR